MDRIIIQRAIKKANQSQCRFKISALGFNRKGELVYSAFNVSRDILRHGGGLHAEQKVMMEAKKKGIVIILICRVNPNGILLPIEPCTKCKKMSEKLGIKIISVNTEGVADV
jgi:cytidine deaminase